MSKNWPGKKEVWRPFQLEGKTRAKVEWFCNYKLFPVARTKNWATNTFTFMGFQAAQLVKNLPAMRRTLFSSWEDPLEREWIPTPVFLGFPGASHSEESTSNVGDLDLIPGLGRPPGGGHGNPLQHFCLEKPHGLRCLVGYIHGVAKSRTWLRD